MPCYWAQAIQIIQLKIFFEATQSEAQPEHVSLTAVIALVRLRPVFLYLHISYHKIIKIAILSSLSNSISHYGHVNVVNWLENNKINSRKMVRQYFIIIIQILVGMWSRLCLHGNNYLLTFMSFSYHLCHDVNFFYRHAAKSYSLRCPPIRPITSALPYCPPKPTGMGNFRCDFGPMCGLTVWFFDKHFFGRNPLHGLKNRVLQLFSFITKSVDLSKLALYSIQNLFSSASPEKLTFSHFYTHIFPDYKVSSNTCRDMRIRTRVCHNRSS